MFVYCHLQDLGFDFSQKNILKLHCYATDCRVVSGIFNSQEFSNSQNFLNGGVRHTKKESGQKIGEFENEENKNSQLTKNSYREC